MNKTLRKLWLGDLGALRAHLKRLDPEARRLRFGGVTTDDFIDAYVDTAFRLDATIFGVFIDGEIRASAELRGIFGGMAPDAEAAFAVEGDWQDQGLGSELMDRILTTAQNRGVARLHMICLTENARMRHIAGKFGARPRARRMVEQHHTRYAERHLQLIDDGQKGAERLVWLARHEQDRAHVVTG